MEKHFSTLEEWRNWLKDNYDNTPVIWLVFYKNKGIPTITYDEAVEEALCYGWIDSIIKKVDEEKYLRKFTPRKDDSVWSELNRKRAEKMISEGRMTDYGMRKIIISKENGKWYLSEHTKISTEISSDFLKALTGNLESKDFYDNLPKSAQKQFCLWINSARQQETKNKRITESIALLTRKERLGLK